VRLLCSRAARFSLAKPPRPAACVLEHRRSLPRRVYMPMPDLLMKTKSREQEAGAKTEANKERAQELLKLKFKDTLFKAQRIETLFVLQPR